MIGYGSIRLKREPESEYAPVVELADTLDLGFSGRPCRFKSCQAHHIKRTTYRSVPAVSVRAARTPLNGVLFLFRLRPASLCSKAGGVSALGAGIFFSLSFHEKHHICLQTNVVLFNDIRFRRNG